MPSAASECVAPQHIAVRSTQEAQWGSAQVGPASPHGCGGSGACPRSPPSAAGRAGPRPSPPMVRVLFLGTSPILKLSLGSTLSHLFGITRTLLSGNSKGFRSSVPGIRDKEKRHFQFFFLSRTVVLYRIAGLNSLVNWSESLHLDSYS